LIYKLPKIRFSSQDWNDLFDSFINLGNFDSILFVGDLNAQYKDWGSTNNNFAGITLNDYLAFSINYS